MILFQKTEYIYIYIYIYIIFFFFRLLIWELMDATSTNNCSVLPRTTVTLSQNTPGCYSLRALPSHCCQQFDHLFVWILPFDMHGLVRPATSWTYTPPLQGWRFSGVYFLKRFDQWVSEWYIIYIYIYMYIYIYIYNIILYIHRNT